MTDLVPADLSFAAPAPRDRRILITAAVSVLVTGCQTVRAAW